MVNTKVMFCNEPLQLDLPVMADQLELIYMNSVRTLDSI